MFFLGPPGLHSPALRVDASSCDVSGTQVFAEDSQVGCCSSEGDRPHLRKMKLNSTTKNISKTISEYVQICLDIQNTKRQRGRHGRPGPETPIPHGYILIYFWFIFGILWAFIFVYFDIFVWWWCMKFLPLDSEGAQT